jgi:hypothetical protein
MTGWYKNRHKKTPLEKMEQITAEYKGTEEPVDEGIEK